MTRRLVSIDVEPGGRSRPVGYIGLAEIVDGEPGTSWLGRFWSPLAGRAWSTWAIELAADNAERWAGLTAVAWSVDREQRECAAVLAEEWGFMPAPEDRAAEWMREEPATFGATIAVVREFIGAAATAAYDARQIAILCAAAGVPAPEWNMLDGRQLVRPLGSNLPANAWLRSVEDVYTRGGNTLDAVQVRFGLMSAAEAAWRKYEHVRWGVGNKGVLHDAEDDAIANAAIFTLAMRAAKTKSIDNLRQHYDLAQYSTTGGADDGR